MAEKNTTEKGKVKRPIPEYLYEDFDKIKKNIEFCKEHNCLEALTEGGKYYRAFTTLIDNVVRKTIEETVRYLYSGEFLPIPHETSPKRELILPLVENSVLGKNGERKEALRAAAITGSEDEFGKIYYEIFKVYSEDYSYIIADLSCLVS